MLTIVINLLTFVLILVSLFMLLVILMQRANSNAGMGSAFGGGVTESTFGAETTNILERATKWSALAFFILALILYLLFMSRESASSKPSETDLPDIPALQEDVPAAADSPALPAEANDSLDATVAESEEGMDAMATGAENSSETAAETEPVAPAAP